MALLANILGSPEVSNLLLGAITAVGTWTLKTVLDVRINQAVIGQEVKDLKERCPQCREQSAQPKTTVLQ